MADPAFKAAADVLRSCIRQPLVTAEVTAARMLAAAYEAEADELTHPDMREKGTYIVHYLRVRAAALRASEPRESGE